MKKNFVFLMPVLLAVACVSTDKKKEVKNDSTQTENNILPSSPADSVKNQFPAMKDAAGDIPGWANSLVMAYVKTCDDPLIQYAVKDSSISWLVDRIEETDTATFMIFHLGHHMEDEDHSNPRFATDGWLYIDTLSKKVYQYDLPNDSLIRWYGKP